MVPPCCGGRIAGIGEAGWMTFDQPFVRRSARAIAVAAVALLSACGASATAAGAAELLPQPREPDAEVDAGVAASMISGYRSNNGLSAVDHRSGADAARREQAHAMAQRDKLDHDVVREFKDRLRQSGSSERRGENVGAGYHTLAEAFSGWRDSPPHRANICSRRRDPHGHRRGLRAGVEIQGVLGADPRRPRRAARVARAKSDFRSVGIGNCSGVLAIRRVFRGEPVPTSPQNALPRLRSRQQRRGAERDQRRQRQREQRGPHRVAPNELPSTMIS